MLLFSLDIDSPTCGAHVDHIAQHLAHGFCTQELQAAHQQVLDGHAEGRSLQELADLAQQPMPVVQAWLQVGPLSSCSLIL